MPINPKICIPCASDNLQDFIYQINIAQDQTNYIELRLDALFSKNNNLYLNNINTLFKSIKPNIKIIATCRQKKYGGFFEDSTEKQQEILQYANDCGCHYIDIDYPIYNMIKISNLTAKTIISYHEFESQNNTNINNININNLNKIYKDMSESSADIIKLAIHCNNNQDVKALYSLLNTDINQHSNNNKKIILIGMGEAGKITRIITPILGGYLTFAMLKEQEQNLNLKQFNAPGQINISELKLLYKNINNLI